MAMQQANETASFGGPPVKDWRKFVTLDKVSHLRFSYVEGAERAQTSLRLINKGDAPIMFKIKTTKPERYLVRPSNGVIGEMNEVEVLVFFTKPLDSPVSTHTHSNYWYTSPPPTLKSYMS